MSERDALFLAHILAAIADIDSFVVGGHSAFMTDRKTQSAVLRELAVIGEAVKNLSPELVAAEPGVPWRQIAGTRGSTLIINLPGNPPAIKDCLEAVMPAVPYCIDLMEGPWLEFNEECGLKAFRPKHAKKPGT